MITVFKRFFFFLILTSLTSFLSAAGTREPVTSRSQPMEATILYLEGEVLLNGVDAQIGEDVFPGDQITTGLSGMAELSLGDQNIMQLGEGTSITISAEWGGVKLEKGILSAVLNGIKSMKRGFEVTTNVAQMGVRGTSFFVRQPDEENTYFCTCNGKLHIEGTEGENSVDTKAYHHAALWLRKTDSGIVQESGVLEYHDDNSMDELARKGGTEIPWR